MTKRFFALTVLLTRDIRADDAERVIKAIEMLKHVQKVVPEVSDLELWAATERARHALGQKLMRVVYPDIDVVAE